MATITSTTSGNWSAGATWVGGTKPADGDSVVIASGHSVLMDEDQSAFATGITGLIIQGGVTPGMLYFKDGTNGYLTMANGYQIEGTLSTNKGRILANSDGVWGNTGELSINNTAIIEQEGSCTANRIYCPNLDIRLYCATPTYKYVITYGTKYDFTASTAVDPDNDTIDLGTTPPTAGTLVTVATNTGTLPGGLKEFCLYYIRSVSGNTCKLALRNADADIVDITSVGSVTVSILT